MCPVTLGVLKVPARMQCPASGEVARRGSSCSRCRGCQARCAHEGLPGPPSWQKGAAHGELSLLNLRLIVGSLFGLPLPQIQREISGVGKVADHFEDRQPLWCGVHCSLSTVSHI